MKTAGKRGVGAHCVPDGTQCAPGLRIHSRPVSQRLRSVFLPLACRLSQLPFCAENNPYFYGHSVLMI